MEVPIVARNPFHGGVDLARVMKYVEENGGAGNLALGLHDGAPGQVVRLDGPRGKGKPGLLMTTVHDNYFMFVKFNVKMGETSDVRAIAEANGKHYSATKNIKVTIGGCGG